MTSLKSFIASKIYFQSSQTCFQRIQYKRELNFQQNEQDMTQNEDDVTQKDQQRVSIANTQPIMSFVLEIKST